MDGLLRSSDESALPYPAVLVYIVKPVLYLIKGRRSKREWEKIGFVPLSVFGGFALKQTFGGR